jgi:hypothetical protein
LNESEDATATRRLEARAFVETNFSSNGSMSSYVDAWMLSARGPEVHYESHVGETAS